MQHIDIQIDYHAGVVLCWNTITDKAGQHHAELKTVLSTIHNDLLHEFIDKAIVSFCIKSELCVVATGGHIVNTV